MCFAQAPLDSLTFDTISQADYERYTIKYNKKIRKGIGPKSPGHLKKLGLIDSTHCHEICETYLVDKKQNKRILLPSNYDAGLLGMLFSPSGKKMILFSSYDGSDYDNYYDYRSEFIVYNIKRGKGLDGIKFDFDYTSNDWSIEDLVWINNKSIALTIYEEDRWGDGSHLSFKFLKARLK